MKADYSYTEVLGTGYACSRSMMKEHVKPLEAKVVTLEAEVERLKQDMGAGLGPEETVFVTNENAALRADNERLRAERDELRALDDPNQDLVLRIEAALAEANVSFGNPETGPDPIDVLSRVVKALKGEKGGE